MSDQNPLLDLSPENLNLLRQDVQRWREILNKKTVNALLVVGLPDGTLNTSRRDGLNRLLLVVEALLAEVPAAKADDTTG